MTEFSKSYVNATVLRSRLSQGYNVLWLPVTEVAPGVDASARTAGDYVTLLSTVERGISDGGWSLFERPLCEIDQINRPHIWFQLLYFAAYVMKATLHKQRSANEANAISGQKSFSYSFLKKQVIWVWRITNNMYWLKMFYILECHYEICSFCKVVILDFDDQYILPRKRKFTTLKP